LGGDAKVCIARSNHGKSAEQKLFKLEGELARKTKSHPDNLSKMQPKPQNPKLDGVALNESKIKKKKKYMLYSIKFQKYIYF
jgi:hypothetical protein